jgi:two-component system sensor histidine kinase VicK
LSLSELTKFRHTSILVEEFKFFNLLYNFNVEKTEVLNGIDNIINRTLHEFSKIKKTYNNCTDSRYPSVLVTTELIRTAYNRLKERGVRVIFITEITNDNIYYSKQILKIIGEIRHLDGVKGNLAIADGNLYAATATVQARKPIEQLVVSNVKALVEQQQYFFDMLWNKAIPAKQRIKEIEEGLKREFIETIRDPTEVQSIIPKLILSATEEIMLTFPTVKTFNRFQKEEMLDLLKSAATNNGIKIRILVDRDIEKQVKNIQQLIRECPNITVQHLNPSTKIQVITIIADRELSLVMELKNDSKESTNEALGLSTYSNSESTVLSYASIFETLWIQSEIAGGVY